MLLHWFNFMLYWSFKKWRNKMSQLNKIFIIVALLFASTLILQSQDCDGDPCVDMAGCPWVSTHQKFYPDPTNCPGCWIEVHYSYRDNSNCSTACPQAPPL